MTETISRERNIFISKKVDSKKNYPLQNLSPYIGKLKENLVGTLIEEYTKPGDILFDPFIGSGVVALEALIAKRGIVGCDINPYAFTITKGKLHAPQDIKTALTQAKIFLKISQILSPVMGTIGIEPWIREFFHPRTLREAITLARLLRFFRKYFLLSCLLSILHHQRPGFLSYPASHIVPYLRNKMFPRKEFPNMYEYRDVKSRLLKKIFRVYKNFPDWDRRQTAKCYLKDSLRINLKTNYVDAIITSPPYMNALSYGRDNRLRLRFIGEKDYKKYDAISPKNPLEYRRFMEKTFNHLGPFMKDKGVAIFIIGDVKKNGHYIDTKEILIQAATNSQTNFSLERVELNPIPDQRRARRLNRGTKNEWIIVLRKVKNGKAS